MILHSEWHHPRVVRCARFDCRTTVTDDTSVQCPHGETFCQGCTWEEACIACASQALYGDPTHERAYQWPELPEDRCGGTGEVWVHPLREHDTGEYVTAPCPDCAHQTGAAS